VITRCSAALALLVAFALFASSALGAQPDVRGTWDCCTNSTNPLVGAQTWVVTSEDLNTGQWSGWGYGGAYTWPMNGTVTGNQITANVPYYYQLPSYSSHGTGTINGRTWNSNFTDSNGNSGTFTLTKASAPQPVAGKLVDAATVSGTVLVEMPGTKTFLDLAKVATPLPIGTIVDATKGRVRLTAAQSVTGKKVGVADFYGGEFRIAQVAAARAITNLVLVGGNFAACGKSAGVQAAQKHKIRMLWGVGKGLFRTTGKYASATIRGTKWEIVDYCDGTLTKVTQGVVTVRDFGRKRNVIVRAGHQYFARKR
jgi:hypothetical protein